MKKVLLIFFIFIGMLFFVSCSLQNETDDYETVTLPDGTLELVAYKGNSAVINLPNKLNFKPVSTIGIGLFRGNTNVTSITLSKNIKIIGNYAFEGCTSLQSIHFNEGITSYGYEILSNCDSLKTIEICNKASLINLFGYTYFFGEQAINTPLALNWLKIKYCPNDEVPIKDELLSGMGNIPLNIELTGNWTQIRDDEFYCCSGLLGILIPDSVQSIGDYAFYGCSALTDIVIPHNVQSIGNYAFQDCKSLRCIVMPNKVKNVSDYAFYGCESLGSIVIPHNVQSIGNYAFYGCKNLGSILMPNKVKSIGDYAFYGCSILTDIVVPYSVQSIGKCAFGNCKSLGSIVIPSSVTSIDGYAFKGCSNLTIHCEASSQPRGWDDDWNSSNRPVSWEYKK